MRPTALRVVLFGLVALVAAAVGAVAFQSIRGPAGDAYGVPFALVDQDGKPVTEAAFRGHPSAVFFGFTHCPEVCPTTLFEMDGWLKELGPAGEDVRAYFVSVDPERDTPEVLKAYVGNVSDRITGLTGEPEAVAGMAKGFNVLARKVPLETGGYTMDHTATVYLLDKGGQFTGTIAYQEAKEQALTKIRRLIG